jgi:NAD(P)-dependent dehydrogenase (short-subunit alcohol dehydrogenase family)
MKTRFQDKVVVITGATGGMGRALSRRFGRAGAKLGLLDLQRETVAAFADELHQAGIQAHGCVCDVTDEQACHAAVQNALAHFGRIDVLINNAGITQRSAFAQTQSEVFRRVMNVNFFGALYCTQAALPALIASRGAIIVMSSIAGFSPLFGRSGYSASKHALHGLFESLRTELREAGVHVMMVCPGFTATGIEKNALGGDGQPATQPRSTTGRIATPEEVAEAIYRAAQKKQRLLVLSRVGKLAYWVSRFMPAWYERTMYKRLRHELQPKP